MAWRPPRDCRRASLGLSSTIFCRSSQMSERDYQVIVVGAGAAGMMCAAVAGQRGRRVLLLDHADKLAEKIRISGGGRCNFTNLEVTAANFLSSNPHFCRSALSRYGSRDFIELVERHGIAYHEKTLGQLFCDDSSQQIIDMLLAECAAGAVDWAMPCRLGTVSRDPRTLHARHRPRKISRR